MKNQISKVFCTDCQTLNEIVEINKKIGADVNYNLKGYWPFTPLYAAIDQGNDIAFELLRVNGARLELPKNFSWGGNCKDYGIQDPKTILQLIQRKIENTKYGPAHDDKESEEKIIRLRRIKKVISEEI